MKKPKKRKLHFTDKNLNVYINGTKIKTLDSISWTAAFNNSTMIMKHPDPIIHYSPSRVKKLYSRKKNNPRTK